MNICFFYFKLNSCRVLTNEKENKWPQSWESQMGNFGVLTEVRKGWMQCWFSLSRRGFESQNMKKKHQMNTFTALPFNTKPHTDTCAYEVWKIKLPPSPLHCCQFKYSFWRTQLYFIIWWATFRVVQLLWVKKKIPETIDISIAKNAKTLKSIVSNQNI